MISTCHVSLCMSQILMTISYCIFRRRFNALIFVSYIVSSQHQRGGMTRSCCKELKETNIPSLMFLSAANAVICCFVELDSWVQSLLWASSRRCLYRSRISSVELNILSVLVAFFETFKSQETIKLLSDVDFVSHDCNMTDTT